MNIRALLLVVVAVIAAIGGVIAGVTLFSPEPPPQFHAGTLLSAPRPLPEFELRSTENAPFTRADLGGDWTLVFFGFTHCPDVCPNTLFMLDRVVDQLRERKGVAPRVLFVSVDAERDSPETIRAYLDYFDPAFIGATGDRANLDRITQAMSVAYELQPLEQGYDVIHSSTIVLIGPDAAVHGFFTPPLHADAIAADVAQLLGRS
ncbi:MAG TPA: SCO family protein [Gammaproteobacteria bacterium]|nr:SCO family protein [Gammaproteobacteria bacterium]